VRRFHSKEGGVSHSLLLGVSVALLMLLGNAVWSAETAKKIVLIGGPKSHGVGEHDFPDGIRLLKEFLEDSPEARDVKVVAFPDGWPMETSALDGASTLVLYFDGVQGGEDSHPLFNAAHREQFQRLMKQSAGVVALHQASTVPATDTTIDLPRWLGGARYGTVDRTTEAVLFKPASHPISSGVGEFLLHDEFYPTIRFLKDNTKVTPILTGALHPQFRNGKNLVIDQAEMHAVAWAFERADGGRAFTFTGLHYLEGLDNPPLRELLLNAMLWTAKIEVPKEGARTAAPMDAATILVSRQRALASAPSCSDRAHHPDHGR
jgi:hypothetical protein